MRVIKPSVSVVNEKNPFLKIEMAGLEGFKPPTKRVETADSVH